MSRIVTLPAALAVCALLVSPLVAETAFDAKKYEATMSKAIDFLKTKGQLPDGSFAPQAAPGITALVLSGVLRAGYSPDEPWIAKGLKYIEGSIQPDGGVGGPKARMRNYETCLAITCFAEANKDHRYDKLIKQCDAFVKSMQWDESKQKEKDDFDYGGAGYDAKSRPDLSNTHYLVEALRASGNDENSDAIKRALVFVGRCQNLESEHNTTPFAAKVNDGGFYYTPSGEGNSPAGKEANGGLRSYGAMTYAGLKSMLYAGVKSDDPRVKAASTWIKKNYDLKANPGLADNGLYYYYHLVAKAFDALKEDKITDASGKVHDWRAEMLDELAARQKSDGSWVNDNKKWFEGDPNMVTGFAILALTYAKPAK